MHFQEYLKCVGTSNFISGTKYCSSHRVAFNDDWDCNENARLVRGNNEYTTRLPSVKLKQWQLETLKLIYRNVHVPPPCSFYYATCSHVLESGGESKSLHWLDWTSTYWYLVIYVCVWSISKISTLGLCESTKLLIFISKICYFSTAGIKETGWPTAVSPKLHCLGKKIVNIFKGNQANITDDCMLV